MRRIAELANIANARMMYKPNHEEAIGKDARNRARRFGGICNFEAILVDLSVTNLRTQGGSAVSRVWLQRRGPVDSSTGWLQCSLLPIAFSWKEAFK